MSSDADPHASTSMQTIERAATTATPDAARRAVTEAAGNVDASASSQSQFASLDPLSETPVPVFPAHALPAWLRDFVVAEAEATQTPLDLAGLLSLGAIATACAKRVTVEVRPGWREPINVFVVVAQPPGSRKSQVFADLAAPLAEWESREANKMRPAVARAQEEIACLKARIEMLRRSAGALNKTDSERASKREMALSLAAELADLEAKAPHPPQLTTDDCTPETLASLLEKQGGRMGVWSPEGGEPFEIIRGRYSANSRPNMGVYLQGHAGDRISVDRKRGRIEVSNPAVTVVCAVQPGVIRCLREQGSLRERGLLARFVYGLPPSTIGTRKWEATPVPDKVRTAYNQNIRRLLDLPSNEHTLKLTPEAYRAFSTFGEALEPRLAEDAELGSMADWAGKLMGLVARFAGLLHAAKYAQHSDPFAPAIDMATMEGALALGQYALEHARAAFALIAEDDRTEGAEKLWRHIFRHNLLVTTRRELWQATKGGRFRKIDELQAPLNLLCERGYLREAGGSGGTRSGLYAVNPIARTHTGRSAQAAGGIGGTSKAVAGGQISQVEEEEELPSYRVPNAPNTPSSASRS